MTSTSGCAASGKNRSRLRCQDVELVTCDAADYVIPDDMTIAYFFYPFAGETFRHVIENIVAPSSGIHVRFA